MEANLGMSVVVNKHCGIISKERIHQTSCHSMALANTTCGASRFCEYVRSEEMLQPFQYALDAHEKWSTMHLAFGHYSGNLGSINGPFLDRAH
jgi:hypothetical protein